MTAATDSKRMNFNLDSLNWPAVGVNVSVLTWSTDLWERMPSLASVSTGVTIAFMVFQMADKLGWLNRMKRKE